MQESARRYLEKQPDSPIFQVKLGTKFEERDLISQTFLDHLPDERRQQFNCRACRKFMREKGILVCVDPITGDLIPLFWDTSDVDLPLMFKDSVDAVVGLLKQNLISAQYVFTPSGDSEVIGVPESGGFRHMHFDFDGYWKKRGSKPHIINGLKPASTVTLVEMLDRILTDNDKETVDHAAYLLLEDKLPYSDNHKGQIRWLKDLYESGKFSVKNDAKRQNLLYYHAAIAFIGCINSLRNGMVSELLAMIRENLTFDDIAQRWSRLADPLAYMRPIAAPKVGNIAAAEKLFAELKLTEQDMRRAFLHPDQIPSSAFLYRSPPQIPAREGIFSNVIPRVKSSTGFKGSGKMNVDDIPASCITFTKFVNEILPTARKVEYKLPAQDWIFFFITGLPGTTPLMQWHTSNNLVSWYTSGWKRKVSEHKLGAG